MKTAHISTHEIVKIAIDNVVENLPRADAIFVLTALETDGWVESNKTYLRLRIDELVKSLETE